MLTDIRQTAFPFIRNLSTPGQGRLWEKRVQVTQTQTSSLVQLRGSTKILWMIWDRLIYQKNLLVCTVAAYPGRDNEYWSQQEQKFYLCGCQELQTKALWPLLSWSSNCCRSACLWRTVRRTDTTRRKLSDYRQQISRMRILNLSGPSNVLDSMNGHFSQWEKTLPPKSS